ncbi:hypothetical protein K523DRAFT_320734 [Schizophyllum commune Tattone D]|nr:hypothetical protein K523DRAFT_320734 [Schizophyllum commune Tattone D]
MTNTPSSGLFPSGPTSPNAFTLFHQSPRETHEMYAALSASTAPSTTSEGRARSSSSSSTLAKLWQGRKKGSKA